MTETVQIWSDGTAPSRPQPADCTLEQLAEMRYAKALDELVANAAEAKMMHVLADALAWTFAHVGVRCGVAATGDMLRRVGGYIVKVETRRQAEEEAQRARREGRLPN